MKTIEYNKPCPFLFVFVLFLMMVGITGCAGVHGPAGTGPIDKTTLDAVSKYAPGYRAQGNEPFWKLDMEYATMTFTPLDGRMITATIDHAEEVSGGYRYVATSGDDVLEAKIVDQICTDDMTGMPYPETVTLAVNDKTFQGCGGNPEDLILGVQWEVLAVNGKGVIDNTQITMTFRENKRISGYASCNAYGAEYTLTGEYLSISEPASTRMACQPEIMAQENGFFNALQNVIGFKVNTDDRLILRTRDGGTITATTGRQ